MPIHDQSYRHYSGSREPAGRAWLTIASAGIRSMARKRKFLGLMLIAWIPFIVYAVRFYLSANYSQVAAFLAADVSTYRGFFDSQALFILFIAIWSGAGLIANDKRANSLQIYLSKPLTRSEYVAGKACILVTFLMLVTWVPAMLLLLLHMLFAGSFGFIRAHMVLFPAITIYSIVLVLTCTFSMLALSSLSNSSRFVAILYVGATIFVHSVFRVTALMTGTDSLSWLSPWASVSQVGNVVFRMAPLYRRTPWEISLVAVIGIIVTSLVILERRVRGVEVVS